MRVAFRVDASKRIGGGHLSRCRALAAALREAGAETLFICRDLPGPLEPMRLGRDGREQLALLALADDAHWSEDARACADALAGRAACDWLVVDHYQLGDDWERAMGGSARRLMAIDDEHRRPHHCDALLNHNYLPDAEPAIRARVPPDCLCLIGPKFALVDPRFARLRRDRSEKITRVLVCFGGSDALAPLSYCLNELTRREFARLDIDVVCAERLRDDPQIAALAERLPNATLHGPMAHLADWMAAADLLIGGVAVTTWEAMSAGLPLIAVTYADNQRNCAAALAKDGLIQWVGDIGEVGRGDLSRALCEELDHGRLRGRCAAARRIWDGRGAERAAAALARLRD